MIKQRYPLALAETVATSLITHLVDACERVQVAGSIRRRRQDVGDIELLCVPLQDQKDLWGNPLPVQHSHDAVTQRVQELISTGFLALRVSEEGKTAFGAQNKLLVHLATGIPVDVFSVPPENWGMALLVRTGPADFCKEVMSTFLTRGMQGHAYGGVTRNGFEVPCPDEETVYELLGWRYQPPELRGKAPRDKWTRVRAAVAEERDSYKGPYVK